MAPKRDPQRDLAEFSDEALDALADVTPADLEAAKLAWRRDTAGTGYERLLDATTEEEDDAGEPA
jgi:hypothetical protein